MRLLMTLLLSSLSLITSAALCAEDHPFNNVQELQTPSVELTEGLPSNIVNGTVSAISGEYIDSSVDIVLQGPRSLVFSRNYSSLIVNGSFFRGWNNSLDRHVVAYKAVKNKRDIWALSVKQPGGSTFTFTHPMDRKKSDKIKTVPFNFVCPKGLTNGSDEISGRTNVKNLHILYDHDKEVVESTTGAGHKSTYVRAEKGNKCYSYRIDKETNARNQILKFSAGPKFEVKKAKSRSAYSYITTKENKDFDKKHVLTLNASDGQSVTYKFHEHKYFVKSNVMGTKNETPYVGYYLYDVDKAHAPKEKYEYQVSNRNIFWHITKKILPDDRFLSTEYYSVGTHKLGGDIDTVKIKDENDYRMDRVYKQKAPVGIDQTPITTHRYVYNANIKTNPTGQLELTDGSTDVYDALWHKTTYEYNEDQRLKRIKKYKGDKDKGYSRYLFEGYVWGENNTNKEGNLLSKFVGNEKTNQIHHGYHFEYDPRGNILQKTYYGKLTGNPFPSITLEGDRVSENGYERENTNYSYSIDGLNLLKSEEGSNGNALLYDYYPGTDLLKSKFLRSPQHLRELREFYYYNDDSVLIKKIVDNGSGESDGDLCSVTERHITYYTPQTVIPIGLHEQIDEMYLDLTTGKEVLLKRTTCKYSKRGQLKEQTIYDAEGNSAFTNYWKYDLHGNVKYEKNALDEIINREYDDNNNLIKQQGPHLDYSIENSYDCSNRLIKQEEIHKDGSRFVITNRYNYLNQRIASTNTYGHETLYTYNDIGLLIETTLPQVANEAGVLGTPVIKTKYDLGGFPVRLIDAMGHSIVSENNVRGKPIHVTFPDGTEEWYTYRLDGKLTQKIGREGTKTVYSLDPQGRSVVDAIYGPDGQFIKSIERTYNAFHLSTETDSEGMIIHYSYDFAGRLVQTFKNEILVQELSYDNLGRISQIVDWIDSDHYRVTEKSYDLLNRVLVEKICSPSGEILKYQEFAYDCLGNKTKVQEGDQITLTTYNSQNNPIKIVDGAGNTTYVVYNMAFVNEHQQLVLQTTTTDPLGNQTIHTYDTANRLKQTTRKNSLGELLSNQTLYYDFCGNCTRMLDDVIYEKKVEKSIETVMTYTVDNQVDTLTEAAGTPEQKSTFYKYNGYTQKSVKIKPDGVQILYDYDGLGRLKTISASDNSLNYQYEYNRRDQVTKVTDLLTQTTTERSYNGFGELVEEKLGNGLVTTFTYDLLERPTRMTLPDKSAIEYVYNAMDLKEIHRVSNGSRTYSHYNTEHNLAGVVTEAALPGDNGTIHYQYDQLNRCIGINSKLVTQTVPTGGYDASGNLLKYTAENQECSFTYDDLYQVKSENSHVTHHYSSDSLYNRKLKDGVHHEHNSLNQVVTRGDEQYTYDANGNMTQKIDGDDKTIYTYDALDRLAAVNVNGVITNYQYDPFHRRLSKKQQGKTDLLFIYQGDEEIGAWQDDTLIQLKVLNHSQRKSVAVELNQTPYIPVQDIFGHVVSLSDMQGNLVERYRYSAFGEVEIQDGAGNILETSINPWQYSNKRFDQESGLTAYGLRYYDPDLGRWISPDPAGFEDGPNLYAHVHNNPLKYFDMLGLFSWENGNDFTDTDFSVSNDMAYFTNTVKDFTKSLFYNSDPADVSGIYSVNSMTNMNGQKINHYPQSMDYGFGLGTGICNTKQNFDESMTYIGGLVNHNVIGVYESTHGLFKDLGRYANAYYTSLSCVRLLLTPHHIRYLLRDCLVGLNREIHR